MNAEPIDVEIKLPNLASCFAKAKSCDINEDNPQERHRLRSQKWVETLAGEFKSLTQANCIRTFSKYNDANRTDFGLNELLFDILVCETGTVKSSAHQKELLYIKRAMWVVESEMAKDCRQAVIDFSKLVLADSENKLFIGPQVHDSASFIKVLKEPARYCKGKLFLALIPHPEDWDKTDHVGVWRFKDFDWKKLES